MSGEHPLPGDRPEPGGTRARQRTSPIGRRIALLLTIPLISLTTLWGFSASDAISAALQRRDFSTLYEGLAFPVGALAATVQAERAGAVTLLTARTEKNVRKFRELAGTTDALAGAYQKAISAQKLRDAMRAPMPQHLVGLTSAVEELKGLRAKVDSGLITPLGAIDAYSVSVDTAVRVLTGLASVDDVVVYRTSNSLLNLFWSHDFMLRQNTLLTVPRKGKLPPADRAAFARWTGSQKEFFDLGRHGLDGKISGIIEQFAGSPAYVNYRTLAERVVNEGTTPPPRTWAAAITAVSPTWIEADQVAGVVMNDELVQPVRDRILLRFYLAGGLGLLAVILSVALSLLFARRITRELGAVRQTAQFLANDRLPRVVARLRAGETVDVEAEAPRPVTGKTREIAHVAEAFATVQRTAVRTAIGEAELRRSISSVFVNLSWRSQSLLHRQLRLLDQMERRASSPDELDDLFRLDHLTTRMRRHAEGLVILSGSPTVRAWDHPVVAEDVVRAAIAEVEDYTRIEVTGASSAAVNGTVVADVIHLLAELIENAASFSPPATEVTVKIETVGNGLVIEIVDRGLGLPADELAEINRRLAESPEFDLVDTDRLGLFVVARLADRHKIKVSLHPSPYGGTTAIVLVPHTVVTNENDPRNERPAVESPTAGRPRSHAAAERLDQTRPRPALPAPPQRVPRQRSQPPQAPQPYVAPFPAEPFAPEPVAEAAGPLDSELTGRLPRRQKQRHMAPQLRERTGPRHAGPEQDDDFDEASPELSRDLMTSLQSGWLRGRRSEDNDPHEEMGPS